MGEAGTTSGGELRAGRRWAAAGVAFAAALTVAGLAVVTNLATNAVPASWAWASDGRVLWPLVGLLAVLSAVLAGRAARSSQGGAPSQGSVISTGPGSVISGAGPAVGAMRMGNTSGVTIVAPSGPVRVAVPEPVPVSRPGQLMVGELPGAPLSFQDRPQVAELGQMFEAGARIAVVCALTGARGVGKTQIAAAYAREQVIAGCPLVAWVSAETTDRLVADLAEVAHALGVADPEGDSAQSVARLRAHLQTRAEPAVLVIDNAVDADLVRRVVPVTGPTRVIVTSTDQALAQLGSSLDVAVFDRAQSRTYLRERTGLNDDRGADLVAEEVGDLALALAQAASVIQLHRISYAEYLIRLRGMPVAHVLARRAGDPYPKGTAEAIVLSVQAVEDTDESGLITRLLAMIAVLSPAGVDRALLRQVLDVGDGQAPDPAGLARVDEMLARLVGLSLLVWGTSGTSVIVHRLVARVLRDRLQATGTLAATILSTVEALTPLQIPEEHAWAQREQGAELVAHTLTMWDIAIHTAGDQLTSDQLTHCAQMANWAVRHLTVTADLSRAVRTGVQVLADCERVLGPDHPNTLSSRNNLAGAYESAGQLDQAIPLYQATLTDRERVLGPDHPNTLTSRNNLAGAYESAGQLDQAIALYQATLTDCERVLGPDHPTTSTVRNNLRRARER